MSLASLPDDIFIDHLLPLLPIPALLALTCTSKRLAGICSDLIVWKRKLETDYNYFPSSDTARVSGFKMIYKGIHRPKVFIWGGISRLSNHLVPGRQRLSHDLEPGAAEFCYPNPIRLKNRIVTLVSGGWSFIAVDDSGSIHAWGHMDDQPPNSPPENPSFAEPGSATWTPVKLQLPVRIVSVVHGGRYFAALDSESRVWIIRRWGRPSLLTFTGTLDGSATASTRHPSIAHTKIIQVSCGYEVFVSLLSEDGQVFVTWPRQGLFLHQDTVLNSTLDQEGDGHPANAVDGVVACIPVSIKAEPLLLPDIPLDLPNLHPEDESDDQSPLKLIKLASGRGFIIGLTNKGHVLCINVREGDSNSGMEDMTNLFSSGRTWVYLPQFCELDDIVQDPVFEEGTDGVQTAVPPKALNITHISGHYNHFVAYSTGESSIVLVCTVEYQGGGEFEFTRTIYPNFQNKKIISVVLADYHFGALDEDGTLYTWGTDNQGSIGQGPDASEVPEPTPVLFDKDHPGRRRFCFSATTGGWHMAALAFDLDNYPDDEEVEKVEDQVAVPNIPQQTERSPSVKSVRLLLPLFKFFRDGESKWRKWWRNIRTKPVGGKRRAQERL